MAQKRMSKKVEKFRVEVDRWMKKLYLIDWADACGDEEPLLRAIERGESPEAFVRWWGEKYDLTPAEELKAFKPSVELAADFQRLVDRMSDEIESSRGITKRSKR